MPAPTADADSNRPDRQHRRSARNLDSGARSLDRRVDHTQIREGGNGSSSQPSTSPSGPLTTTSTPASAPRRRRVGHPGQSFLRSPVAAGHTQANKPPRDSSRLPHWLPGPYPGCLRPRLGRGPAGLVLLSLDVSQPWLATPSLCCRFPRTTSAGRRNPGCQRRRSAARVAKLQPHASLQNSVACLVDTCCPALPVPGLRVRDLRSSSQQLLTGVKSVVVGVAAWRPACTSPGPACVTHATLLLTVLSKPGCPQAGAGPGCGHPRSLLEP